MDPRTNTDNQTKKVLIYSSTSMHNSHKHMVANPPKGFEYQKEEYLATLIKPPSNNVLKSLFEKVRWSVSPHYNYLHIYNTDNSMLKL